MADPVKFKVFPTLTLTLQKSIAIARRHWLLVAIYSLVAVAIIGAQAFAFSRITFSPRMDPTPILPFLLLWPLYALSIAVLAVVAHNEALRGTGGLDAATLGSGLSRVFGYILDIVTLFFVYMIAVVLLIGVVVAVSGKPGPNGQGPGALLVLGFIGVWLALVCVMTRMSLRFPSRAIGPALPWRQVWALGRGNTWRLIAGMMLLSFVLSTGMSVLCAPAQFVVSAEVAPLVMKNAPTADWPMPTGGTPYVQMPAAKVPVAKVPGTLAVIAGIWLGLVFAVAFPASAIVMSTYLSVVYATLRQAPPDAALPAAPAAPLP